MFYYRRSAKKRKQKPQTIWKVEYKDPPENSDFGSNEKPGKKLVSG